MAMRTAARSGGFTPGIALAMALLGGPAWGQSPAPVAPRAEGKGAEGPEAVEANRRRMDEILARWEQAAARRTSLSVRFVETDRGPNRVDSPKLAGEALFRGPSTLSVRYSGESVAGGEEVPGRIGGNLLVWNDRELRYFDASNRSVRVQPGFGSLEPGGIARNRLQYALVEPPPLVQNLFGAGAADLRRDYVFTLAAERDGFSLVEFATRPAPRENAGTVPRPTPTLTGKVLLEGASLMPKLLLISSTGSTGTTSREYRILEIADNAPIPPGRFDPPNTEGWEIFDLRR